MKPKTGVGIFIIIVTVLIVGGYSFAKQHNFGPFHQTVTVKGDIGGEKVGFFGDPAVVSLLQNKYHINVDARKNGSISMVKDSPAGKDFLSPSNKFAVEIFSNGGNKFKKSDTIFYSPLVIYSWRSMLPTLQKAGVVTNENNAYYIDLPQLIGLIEANKTWAALGDTTPGKINVFSTDPNKSNSGNMFAGLVANTMNQGNVVTDADLTPDLSSRLKKFFDRMGYTQSSSEDIFKNFLAQGKGAYPFVVGYENQLLEYVNGDPTNKDYVNGQVVMLYMKPTVWADHEFISLNDNGSMLMNALLTDQKLKDIAWQQHGFRQVGVRANPATLPVQNVARDISYTTSLPRASVMEKIMDLLQ